MREGNHYRVQVDNVEWRIHRQVASGVIAGLALIAVSWAWGWSGFLAGVVVALVVRFSDWMEWKGQAGAAEPTKQG